MEEINLSNEEENNYLFNFPKAYQTINSNKILENIKEAFNNENYSLAKLYLFLMKLSNKSDYFGVKIQTVYYKSEIALKEKNIFESIRLGHKIISWINYLDIKKYNVEVITTLIQVLINSSEVSQDSHPLLSCWFLFVAKNIFMKYPNKNSFINDIIKTKFPFVIKKISANLKDIKDDILDKKSTLLRVGEEVKLSLNNYESNREKYLKEIKSEKIYLINKKWVLNFLSFIQKLSEENIDYDSLFQINPLCLMYFSQKDEEQEENNGIYCGEANNFMLIKPKLFWPDNEQKYSNIFIDKSIVGQYDKFVIFDEEIYNKIKFYMGINYEIERVNNKNVKDINQNINLFTFKIIFLNEEIRDKEKEHIIIKNMQINENDNLIDLIEKIKRGFLGFLTENNYEISEYEYRIYLCNYIKQDVIDIILFYVNLLKHYKIKGVLINDNEFINKYKNILVKNIFNNEQIPQFLCCEVINKNSIVRPFLLKFDPKKISCSTCNLTLNLNSNKKIYQCNFCSQSLYCSEKCKNNDSSHMEFHQKISGFFDNTLKSSDIETINIQSFLDKNSRNGLTGLINIGGTDFLLSSIQALSSCETLTKFILTQSHKYLNDKYVAKDNSSLVSCYSELIYQMWVGTNKEINPSKFRDLFFNQIFKTSRASNLDVLDILIILLEKFHYELNENKKKVNEDEINFYEQQIGESDGVAALRWWKLHKLINDSIIIDLFQGQLKVKISCPICKWTNVSYPPFLYLNLPMPNKDEMTKSTFRVFPYSNNLFNYVEIPIYGINKFTSILNIKNKIAQYKMFAKSNIEAVLFENNELVEILQDKTLIYDYVFPRYDFGDDYFIDYEIAFIEKPENKVNKDSEISLYVTPIVFEEEKGWFYSTKNIVAITYCKYFSFDLNSTVKDLQKEIFKYYRRGFDDKYKTDEDENLDDSYYIEFYQKLNDEKYIEDEYNKFVVENGFFDIYIYHNIPKNDGWIFTGTTCEFCGFTSTKKNCCKLNYTKNVKLKEIIQNFKTQRPLFLLVDFQKYEYMFKSFYHPFIDEKDPHMCLTQDITIYDCLEIYSQEKKLTGEKNFICSKCNRSVTPLQAIYPYSSPKYLILGIQRIKKKFEDLTEMINNKKDDRLVGYPLEDFDVTSYFINDSILNKDNPNKKSIYNLKSIILHCGTIKKSNYKTIVKNRNNWYEIEDNDIKELDINNVINQNAYILIYEKVDKSNENEDKENNLKEKEDNEVKDKNNNNINLEKENFSNKEKKVYLKKEKKTNIKKFKEEEDLLNEEELFGIKSYGEMEDI